MKILLISIGTRGDMEPFLAIGEMLKDKGHEVVCVFPEQFGPLAEDSNLEFASLGKKFIDLLDSDAGKAALGGSSSGFKKFAAYMKLAAKQNEVNKEMVEKQYEIIESEEPDRIVYNGKASYPIIWEVFHPGKSTLISPVPYVHDVRDHTHVAFNSDLGPFLNKLTYSLANFGVVTTTMISKKWLKITKKITRKQIKDILSSGTAIYTISPSLFPRPDYWNDNLKILGYHERNRTTNWQPDGSLQGFLDRHKDKSILFITFGSMTNPNPLEKTGILIEVLKRNNIPAIINVASGGLVEPDNYDSKLFHFLPRIPYEWIFPRVHAVIHHGGSGTTHAALKHGCATMIIPHIIDQFVWDRIVSEMGAGPKGIKIDTISTKKLEPKILGLINNNTFREKAEEIAGKMKREDFRDEICKVITDE